MSDQFIDKTRLNVNNSTNVAAIASLVAAASIVANGLHRHPSEFFSWGPEAIGLVAGAFSQWLQGSPSQETKLIKSVLQLEGNTNAELVRSAINRIIGAGVVPGLDRPPVTGDDVGRSGTSPRRSDAGLNAQTLERMATDIDYSDRGPMPDPNARAAQCWERRPSDLPVAGRPTIDGTNISGPEFAAWSTGGDEDPRSEAW